MLRKKDDIKKVYDACARVAAAALLLFSSGCASIGPGSVSRDRFDYSSAIADSWNRQTLLNIVKIRYMDSPVFVDIGQVVAGYTFESSVALDSGWRNRSGNLFNFDFLNLSGAGKYTDRPTITYTPLTGNAYIRGLMTPITPQAVFSTIVSGWPANEVLIKTVESINGLKNQQVSLKGTELADTRFIRSLELMRDLQSEGLIGLTAKQTEGAQPAYYITIESKNVSEETMEKVLELKRVLKLDNDTEEYRLVFRAATTNRKEIAVQTRSLLRILLIMAAQIDVPDNHVTQGRTLPNMEGDPEQKFINIRHSAARPLNAYVAVKYRGYWFWIDDRDIQSKSSFSFIISLFSLVESGGKPTPPLITIPTQ